METKSVTDCHIIINKQDLFILQSWEWFIFETVVRKIAINLPTVLKQFDQIGRYIKEEITKMETPLLNMSDIQMLIKNLQDEKIIVNMLKQDVCYVTQIKMFATIQLAEC
ncbi:Hypothetical protein CINCED_3A013126 [Cinara cedri]|uniref:Uncharacterized protein n=1 Tax=Cinara cedri TaxID=506608 RepID=A0A5E4M9I9_9HEMI|nr:Hypothetical protein CINCED_3A013126 [Cinara cedri]